MADVETAVLPEMAAPSAADPSNPPNPKPEDLVARAIAPVKPEYLRPPPLRPNGSNEGATGKDNVAPCRNIEDNDTGLKPLLAQEKKSKRQQKRERQQERKSAKNLCPAIARTSDVNSCRYGGNCRFSHDLEAFLLERPEDLPGTCPFVQFGESCPYGVACRYFGTHEEPTTQSTVLMKSFEMNGLDKDFQKRLWKNKVKFPIADAQLKRLGLSGGKGFKQMQESEDTKQKDDDSLNLNGCGLSKEDAEDTKKKDIDSLNTCSLPKENEMESEESEDTKQKYIDCLNGCVLSKEDDKDAQKKDIDSPDACNLPEDAEMESKETLPVTDRNPVCSKEDFANATFSISDLRPSKRTKIPDYEVLDANEIKNDISSVEENVAKDLHETSENGRSADNSLSTRIEVTPQLNIREKKLIDFREKLYLAPLTTVGNLPFRRVCKTLGADITCGEMAMCTNLLQGQASEWALLRRHSSEDTFGVQICGSYPDTIARTIELINGECDVDFIDINMGCPIDVVVNKGAGSSLLNKPMRMKNIIQAASGMTDKPLTVKVRTGFFEGRNRIDSLVADIGHWGATAITIHGRSRQQRYSKLADWEYIYGCARKAPDTLQVMGNGDILSYLDWNKHISDCPQLSSCIIARGALVKPWIFTEIKEQRHWDITSGERLDMLKKYVNFGLQHWGSDSKGVETTRYFLLEWLSYTCRYVPVGLLEVIPQRLNWRPPSYYGRDDLETLMASDSAADWIRISEMLLGKVPDGFSFAPKHKSNSYDRAENG